MLSVEVAEVEAEADQMGQEAQELVEQLAVVQEMHLSQVLNSQIELVANQVSQNTPHKPASMALDLRATTKTLPEILPAHKPPQTLHSQTQGK